MEQADIVKLASLLDDLGAAGREGFEALQAEVSSYHDKGNFAEALAWLEDLKID